MPEDVAPFVVWLGSAAAGEVSGKVFSANPGRITVIESWSNGPSVATDDLPGAEALTPLMAQLLGEIQR